MLLLLASTNVYVFVLQFAPNLRQLLKSDYCM
jgi:hypothetical protein